jgi:hypothetical protein
MFLSSYFIKKKNLKLIMQGTNLGFICLYSLVLFLAGINSVDYIIFSWLFSLVVFSFIEFYSYRIFDELLLPFINDQIVENQTAFFSLIWNLILSNLVIYSGFAYG